MSTNTALPVNSHLTPLRKWWGSTRLAYRIAWQDLRRHTASTILALLLVIVPIVAILVTATVWVSWNGKKASEYANPQGNALAATYLHVDGKQAGSTKTSPAELLAELTERGASSAWGFSRTTYQGSNWQHADVAHIVGDFHDGSPLQLLEGKWPATHRELVVAPYGPLRNHEIGAQVTLRTAYTSQASTYTVVGKFAGPLAASVGGYIPHVLTPAGVTVASPGTEVILHSWLFYVDTDNYEDYAKALGADTPTDHEWETRPASSYPLFSNSDYRLSSIFLMVIPFLLLSFLILGMMSTPSILIASRRHQQSLSIAGHQGATPFSLRRVMTAHATLHTVLATLIAIPTCGALLYAMERWQRSTAVGNYKYATTINTPFLALTIAALYIGMLSAAVFIAHKASRSATSKVVKKTPGVSTSLGVVTLVLAALSAVSLYATAANLEVVGFGPFMTPVYLLGLSLCIAPIALTLFAKLPGASWWHFGLRDANRNRMRTVPIVGAVTAATALAVLASSVYQAIYVAGLGDYTAEPTFRPTVVSVPYSQEHQERLASDVSSLRTMEGVAFAREQAHTHRLPPLTYYDADGFTPQPKAVSGAVDTQARNVFLAAHPSCKPGPKPTKVGSSEQRYFGYIACTHNFSGQLRGNTSAGVYTLKVVIITPGQAVEQFSISNESTQAMRDGAVLWIGGDAAPKTLKLLAWDHIDSAEDKWVYSPPQTRDVPTIKVPYKDHESQEIIVAATPTLAKSLGLNTSPDSLTIGLSPTITSTQLQAINNALPVRVNPPTPIEDPRDFGAMEQTGLWVGGSILLLFVALLILLSNKQVVRESHIVSMLGGQRSFIRLSLAAQLGLLTTLGIVMGTIIAFLFLASLLPVYPELTAIAQLESPDAPQVALHLATLASWPTLLSVMAVVVLTSMAIAASTAPRAKLTTKRQ